MDDVLATLEERIRARPGRLTRAEHAIATHLIENLRFVPFETGAAIAERVGVSEMTVIRFIRSIGYANLKELKEELRTRFAGEDRDLDDAIGRFKVRTNGDEALQESLNLELRAIIKAYELTGTPQWTRIVDLLCRTDHVHVVGFQAVKGVALDFASRLSYVRPGVRFAEGVSGTFAEIFDTGTERSCLVLIDTVAYARKSLLLARKAKDIGLPLVIVTDRFSHWADAFTDNVLEGHTRTGLFWDSTASLSVITALLINDLAARLGSDAEARFRQLRGMGDDFGEFEP